VLAEILVLAAVSKVEHSFGIPTSTSLAADRYLPPEAVVRVEIPIIILGSLEQRPGRYKQEVAVRTYSSLGRYSI
jgi:hypothetical protein